jgi:hypothetical protein
MNVWCLKIVRRGSRRLKPRGWITVSSAGRETLGGARLQVSCRFSQRKIAGRRSVSCNTSKLPSCWWRPHGSAGLRNFTPYTDGTSYPLQKSATIPEPRPTKFGAPRPINAEQPLYRRGRDPKSTFSGRRRIGNEAYLPVVPGSHRGRRSSRWKPNIGRSPP